MAKDLFYQLDLNLLRTFLVLSQELNMRRTSERLHVSQPAISQALQKLRHHFDDELFVKVHRGLQPTAFSENLANTVTPHLDGLSIAINQLNEFDPAKIEQKITVAIPPILLGNLSGPLFLKMKKLAPHAEIELSSWSQSTPDDIRNGHTLLGVQYDVDLSKEVYSTKLASVEARIIVRQEHPIKKKTADMHDFIGYEHASIISRGWNDQFSHAVTVMKEHGLEAHVGFRSDLLTAVIDVTQHTDMIMPHINLFPIEEHPNLRSIIPTINGKVFSVDIFSHFHKRNRQSALVQWLHSLIEETISERLQSH
ncbi:LysR family transcriptional regulator [Vibrio genomosp. F10]|uniref:LysR family transcriptional regulator n=1 Tax=Vibrio genomosp. F10 TaxID=723171 RepID=UPI0002FE36C4|nr:LysR family transcriptional regulator [Vibrio genomosp. F10]OEF09083.1 LysR family transcriptional regulator [Vibrio genomosp. F10 str. 9ZB36]